MNNAEFACTSSEIWYSRWSSEPSGRFCASLLLALVLSAMSLFGCGGGSSGSSTGQTPPPTTYTIGGTITGLSGTGLVLQDNGGNNLSIAAGATTFTFSPALASGRAYSVTVVTQPSNPTQTCTVTSGSGTVAAANITSVQVACTTNTYTIGGTITGLTGTGLVLQNNAGNNLSISGGATSFTFSKAIASGGAYSVTVLTQPSSPAQNCTVSNGSGTVTNANVTNIQVACTTSASTYTIGGSISGLSGTGLVLQDNGGNNLSVAANATSFTFTTPLASGSAYSVTVLTQPSSPTQTCTVTNGGGTAANANVTSVEVACVDSGTLVSINVVPGAFAITTGYNQQFTAEGIFSDGSIRDITNSVIWNSSATSIASVSATTAGLFTGEATGTATITAATGSVSGSTPLTVANVLPRFAYVIENGNLASYKVNPVTGMLAGTGYGYDGSAVSVIVDPSNQFVYAADGTSNTVSAYQINATTGALTPCSGSPFSVSTDPVALAFDKSGKFLYAANSGSNNISAFNINASTGILTPVVGSPFSAGGAPGSTVASMIADPVGDFLFLGSYNSSSNPYVSSLSAYTINPTTGALTAVSGSPFSASTGSNVPTFPSALAIDPTGQFLFVADFTLGASNVPAALVTAYSINGTTGALSPVAGSPFASGPDSSSVAVDSSGKFVYFTIYGSSISGSSYPGIIEYVINPSTGTLTEASSILFSSPNTGPISPHSMAVDPSGSFAYFIEGSSAGAACVDDTCYPHILAYGLNSTTGGLTPLESLSPSVGGDGNGLLALSQALSGLLLEPQFAFVANVNSGTLSAYTVNATTGALTAAAGSPFTAGTQPISVAVDSANRFVYVANQGSNNLSGFSINASTGSLTPVQGTPFAAELGPSSVVVEPSNRFVYVTNETSNNVSGFAINETNGTLTAVSGSPFASSAGPYSSVADPSGQFLYVSNLIAGTVSTFEINTATGALTANSTATAGTEPESIAVDPSGRFVFVANDGSNDVSAFAVESGQLTAFSGSPFPVGAGPASVTVDPSGSFVLVANNGSNNVSVFAIDAATDTLTEVTGSPFAAGAGPVSLAVDPSDEFAYVANGGSNNMSVFSINTTTGTLTPIGSAVPTGSGPVSAVVTGVSK